MAAIESGTLITAETEAEWLAERRKSLGASEAAAALGVSPYATPVDLWQRKVGIAADVEETEAMRWGRLLEPLVLAEYERTTGEQVGCRQLFLRHADHPFLTATLDGVTASGRLVEVKTASAFAGGFGDEECDEIPEPYRVQVHQQFAVSGAAEADLAVLVGGQRLRVYRVAREEALVRAVVQGGLKFWGCVESRTPPSWGRQTPLSLLARYPGCEGETRLSPGVLADVKSVEEANEVIRWHEKSRDEAKLRVLEAIGNARVGILPDGRRVKRYVQTCPERSVTVKAHTKHYFRVLKGDSE